VMLMTIIELSLIWSVETQKAQSAGPENTTNLIPKHDPVEVNKYLISGLSKSEVDSFFEGPAPDERLLDFFRRKNHSLTVTMADVETYLKTNGALQTAEHSNQENISFRRNLLTLVELVISKCSSCFQRAAFAATETAICDSFSFSMKDSRFKLDVSKYVIKDWLEWEPCMKDLRSLKEHFVAYVPSETGANLLCIFHASFPNDRSTSPIAANILVSMNACVPKFMDASRHQYMILDFAILDEVTLVIVLRHLKRHSEGSRPCVALVPWRDPCMKFEPLRVEKSVTVATTREEAVKLAARLVRETQLSVKPLPLKRVHELSSLSRSGLATLVCNGKRKVACIMDENGVIESLDLSTEIEQFEFEPSEDEEETGSQTLGKSK